MWQHPDLELYVPEEELLAYTAGKVNITTEHYWLSSGSQMGTIGVVLPSLLCYK